MAARRRAPASDTAAAPAQNSGKTANLRPFRKGQSGNPGGRPKGLAEYVRTLTKDGHLMADFMVSVLARSGEFEHGRVDLATRIEAATWLADRGFGKPVQSTELSGPDGSPVQGTLTIVIEGAD